MNESGFDWKGIVAYRSRDPYEWYHADPNQVPPNKPTWWTGTPKKFQRERESCMKAYQRWLNMNTGWTGQINSYYYGDKHEEVMAKHDAECQANAIKNVRRDDFINWWNESFRKQEKDWKRKHPFRWVLHKIANVLRFILNY